MDALRARLRLGSLAERAELCGESGGETPASLTFLHGSLADPHNAQPGARHGVPHQPAHSRGALLFKTSPQKRRCLDGPTDDALAEAGADAVAGLGVDVAVVVQVVTMAFALAPAGAGGNQP